MLCVCIYAVGFRVRRPAPPPGGGYAICHGSGFAAPPSPPGGGYALFPAAGCSQRGLPVFAATPAGCASQFASVVKNANQVLYAKKLLEVTAYASEI